ncbi:MAG: TIM barrel protein, partial [Microbacteriaceae bacterium]
LGTPRLNVLAGKAPLGANPDQLHATLVGNVRFAAETLEAAGVQLVIEAVNSRDVPGFVLPRIADADRVRQAAGVEGVGLQYDIYHAQVMQGDLLPTYRRHSEHIRHIQIADHPGRHEPGTGEIRYEFLLPAIAEAGYEGWIGAEYVPEVGAGWLAAFR